MTAAVIILSLVTLQRLAELLLARRNTARLLARGAIEVGAAHYPLLVAMHAAWLVSLWMFGWNSAVRWPALAVFAALQALRVWVLASLGPRWTTRIIVLPDTPLVRSGPYRYVSHPNYAIVAGEIAVLPLALGLPRLALVFSILNAMALVLRIRAESRALMACGGAVAGIS